MTTAVETHGHALSVPTEPPPIDAHRMEGMRGLFALMGTQRPLVIGASLSAVLGVAAGLAPFFFLAHMATAIFATPPRLDEVRTLALASVGAVALRYVMSGLATVLAHVAAFRLLHELRMRLARKLGDVPLSFFATRTTGELKRVMMDDVNQIEAFVAHNFPDGVAAFAVPLLTAAALVSVDYRMALASIAAAPVAVLVMSLALRGTEEQYRTWQATQDRTNNGLLEYLRGIHVIKTFGLTAKSFGDLAQSIEENTRWMERFMRRHGRAYGAFHALIGSSLVVLVPMGGHLYLAGSLALPDLVLFLVLGPQLLTSLMRVMFAWGNVKRIGEGNARIARVLLAPDLVEATKKAQPLHHGLAFRGVGFRYTDGNEALRGVSFEAGAGKVTALVGPSGAGKTTIARLVPRLWEATSGRVEMGGVDVNEIPLDALLERLSVVFQDVFLFHGTVKDNLRLAKPDATDEELVAACKAARAHGFVEALPDGYDTWIGERGARLSGGEKQRLSIARALLKDAPILILDEATAFADPENEALIQEGLATLCQARTVLVIAHRLSTVASADHIVVLDAGEVVDQGPHEALLGRCGLYQELWARHAEARDWSLHVRGLRAAEGVLS
ncbi:ABC transporter ATP-binding protein [Chondromyces crocatus]|uniref:ABC transporter ATP-binding protein n=1 Tax=Chondromyces crocatus TaxID=52 RepID=A0A0K1E795_CHOCO|nr:ABC transporter ATP-binding protein [Chondromyces crocatus]AKT36730.1 ABC transporter ATP-binding protein [Chondromyces crocatus]